LVVVVELGVQGVGLEVVVVVVERVTSSLVGAAWVSFRVGPFVNK
jgi:hypothetical protein